MFNSLLERIVKDNLKKLFLTDKITGFLVKKKRRGTFQAMEESREIEKEMTENVVQFIKEWVVNETVDGFIKKELEKQIKSQIQLELSSKGYHKVDV